MNIKLSKSQWEFIGKKAGWTKTAAPNENITFTTKEGEALYTFLSRIVRQGEGYFEFESDVAKYNDLLNKFVTSISNSRSTRSDNVQDIGNDTKDIMITGNFFFGGQFEDFNNWNKSAPLTWKFIVDTKGVKEYIKIRNSKGTQKPEIVFSRKDKTIAVKENASIEGDFLGKVGESMSAIPLKVERIGDTKFGKIYNFSSSGNKNIVYFGKILSYNDDNKQMKQINVGDTIIANIVIDKNDFYKGQKNTVIKIKKILSSDNYHEESTKKRNEELKVFIDSTMKELALSSLKMTPEESKEFFTESNFLFMEHHRNPNNIDEFIRNMTAFKDKVIAKYKDRDILVNN